MRLNYLSINPQKNQPLSHNAPVIFCILSIFAVNLIVPLRALKSDAYDLKLSANEKSALELFKREVQNSLPEDFMKTDFYLIRWLRVANLNIAEARTLLFQTINWRTQNKIGKILSENWTDMEDNCPMTFDTFDRDGRPVKSIDAGDWDLRTLSLQGKLPRVLRYFHYSNEKQMQTIFRTQQTTGKPVTRFVILMDAQGLNMRQHVTCPSCLLTMMQWYTSSNVHYPEFLAEVIVINAPSVVPVVLNTMKPVMAQDVRERVTVFGTNEKVWKAYLDSRIERSQRRERYGGTKQ